jgi:hypothetical protein
VLRVGCSKIAVTIVVASNAVMIVRRGHIAFSPSWAMPARLAELAPAMRALRKESKQRKRAKDHRSNSKVAVEHFPGR